MFVKNKKIRILLVEDNEDHAELISCSFESYPDEVDIDVIQSLREAAVLSHHHYDQPWK